MHIYMCVAVLKILICGCSSVVEYLFCIYKTVDSIPNSIIVNKQKASQTNHKTSIHVNINKMET